MQEDFSSASTSKSFLKSCYEQVVSTFEHFHGHRPSPIWKILRISQLVGKEYQEILCNLTAAINSNFLDFVNLIS